MARKENPKGGRFLKKKKGKGGLILLLLIILAAAVAVGFLCFGQNRPAEIDPPGTSLPETTGEALGTEPVESTAPTATTLPSETTVPVTEADPLIDYRYIFELYRRAVSEKWDYMACEDNRICYLVMFQKDLSRLGYCLTDLNGDGQQELIITDGNVIYDLYASVQGSIMWVLTGGERNSYQLTEDNRIINCGSNGAASYVHTVYSWDGAELLDERSIIFDAMQDDPWVTTQGDTKEVLTEEEAMTLIDSYKVIAIPFEPIP